MKNTLLLLLISAIFTQTNILTKEYSFYKDKVTNVKIHNESVIKSFNLKENF